MMAEGRCDDAWGRTSALLAQTANIHRDPKKRSRPFEPTDFYRGSSGRETPKPPPDEKVNVKSLKRVLMGMKG